MTGLRFIAALRRIVFGLLVLALSFAPLQAYAVPSSDPGMSMTKSMANADCPQKKHCCDKDKSDCVMDLSCMAQCTGGLASPIPFDQVSLHLFTNAFGLTPLDSIESHASPPLRRPPRI